MMHYHSVHWGRLGILCLSLIGFSLATAHADDPFWEGQGRKLEVTSTTFTAKGPLPDSAIANFPNQQGANSCTANGAAGGDQSPQLQWTRVPPNTRSFVVVMYDTTAAFTHWGMYNIAAHVRALPENAGAIGSTAGSQVNNDFGDPSYDGPCPPAGVPPDAHHYVFTVYALDTELKVNALANFPANAETLYHALIDAARDGHVLASGSLGTHFSATPAAN